ncbi:MAG TPA: hypothetical protein VFT65_15695 [Candidatus Angelobacter sp.]|nr:hypothetical protein [Candidatus Angelobacter sp.]
MGSKANAYWRITYMSYIRYLVVNASDGSPLGLYQPTEETGNNNVCFSRHEGFVFMRFEHNRVKLITAALR